MKIYNTLDSYIKEAKINDRIVFQGMGIIDGIKTLESKHNTHRVVYIDSLSIKVTEYRGKVKFYAGQKSYDQQIAVLTKKEFKDLKVLW